MTDILAGISWDTLDVDEIAPNSFKNFHAKDLDYICLKRTPELTLKAYFFAEGMESQKLGEVINPHDHRYDFLTQCYSGVIENRWYHGDPVYGTRFHQFSYDTPLNGGGGFTHIGTSCLHRYRTTQFGPGTSYTMRAHELHTIRVAASETCIVLAQYEDVIPVGQPTFTYSLDGEPPSLAGLYSEFKSDEIVKRLKLLQELQGRLP